MTDSEKISKIYDEIITKNTHTEEYGVWFTFNTFVAASCSLILFWWYYNNLRSETRNDKKVLQSKRLMAVLSRILIVALLDIVMDD